MNVPKTLAFMQKVFRKLTLGKWGGYCVYLLNKSFNRPNMAMVNGEDSIKFLNIIHEDVKTSSLHENNIITPIYDLQIIIPVYNTSKFLRDCINSVLSQETKYKYHLVIINDGSTDNSGEILSEYASDERVTVITQENKGFSGARNVALQRIFGRYITFLDSDDMLAPDAIANWLDAAYKYDADVVEGSYQRRTPEGKLYGGVKLPKESVENRLSMSGYACMKIFKAEIWYDLHFPEGYWYEDTIMYGLVLPRVKVFVQIPADVYYYTTNRGSISYNSQGKKKSLDGIYITESVLKDADKLGYIRNDYKLYYEFLLYQIHMNWYRTYLLGPDVEYAVFKESCRLLKKYFPEDITTNNRPASLVKALRKKDFDLYRYSNLLNYS